MLDSDVSICNSTNSWQRSTALHLFLPSFSTTESNKGSNGCSKALFGYARMAVFIKVWTVLCLLRGFELGCSSTINWSSQMIILYNFLAVMPMFNLCI